MCSPGVGDEIVLVPEARHQRVEHVSRRRDYRRVVREGVAEAEPWEGRYYQVERLAARGILGVGEERDQVREGKVREWEWGYQ